MELHEIVAAIRQQNWKNGGALVMDTDEAEALMANAIAALEQRVLEAERANSTRPVSALIEAGRLAVRLVERTNTGDYAPDAYEEWEDLREACAAIIAKEETDDRD